MTRKTSFKYFLISKGYAEGRSDSSIVSLSEKGIELLDQILSEQDKQNKKVCVNCKKPNDLEICPHCGFRKK